MLSVPKTHLLVPIKLISELHQDKSSCESKISTTPSGLAINPFVFSSLVPTIAKMKKYEMD
jgi:hypothetical protein